MTGLLSERDFSRRSFLKGGALVVGFSMLGAAGVAGTAKASSASFPVIDPG